jgi:hypothetical protein
LDAGRRSARVAAPGTGVAHRTPEDARADFDRPARVRVSCRRETILAARPLSGVLSREAGSGIPQDEFFAMEQEEAMFAVVRHYHFKPQDGATIDKMVKEGFVPLIKKAKGFIRYYWLDTGNGEGASVSVFTDKAGADESIHLAADYVRDHMAKLVTQKPEIIEGPVKAHD